MTRNERKQVQAIWKRVEKIWMRPIKRIARINRETISEPWLMDSMAKKAYHFIIEAK